MDRKNTNNYHPGTVLFVLLSLTTLLVQGASINSRIISIDEDYTAEDGQFPWHVYLRIFETTGVVHLCGGSVISARFVLTAGHCVKLGYKYEIHGGSVHRLAQPVVVTAHKAHTHDRYDVAVIELDDPLPLTTTLSPVKLPPWSFVGRNLTDLVGLVSGYGYGTLLGVNGMAQRLTFASQRVLAYEECKRIYGSNVNEENMCTEAIEKNGNVCYGDSGGPFILAFSTTLSGLYQMGVVSFGADRGCRAGYPSGYVQTTFVLDWIEQVTDVVIREDEFGG